MQRWTPWQWNIQNFVKVMQNLIRTISAEFLFARCLKIYPEMFTWRSEIQRSLWQLIVSKSPFPKNKTKVDETYSKTKLSVPSWCTQCTHKGPKCDDEMPEFCQKIRIRFLGFVKISCSWLLENLGASGDRYSGNEWKNKSLPALHMKPEWVVGVPISCARNWREYRWAEAKLVKKTTCHN